MALSTTPLVHKESFLQDNQMFTELELTNASKPIGNIQDIDLVDNEIWLLQCPKGMDMMELETQKLKMPGRTNLNDSEAVSMEFTEGNNKHAFAYCSRKGNYALRLLPVRGTIVVRDRLKASDTVTTERVEECCPPAKRVPMPSNIRVRHPLLGFQYEDKLKMDLTIKKRLQEADEVSANILKDSLIKKTETCTNPKTCRKSISENPLESLAIQINSADDDDAVEFVSEEKYKKNKKKRKKSIGEETDGNEASKIKMKKSKKDKEIVSKDLQWLQNI